jgi:arylamine N-acetyltransferase
MNLIQIVERLRIIYENIEHLLGIDEQYDIEDLIEEIEQEILHGERGGLDEEN